MLPKVVHDITEITDNSIINLENYMESIGFINNVYTFINKIKLVTSVDTINFLPSFKGRMTCEKFNIECTDERESEMKYFIISCRSFLEDKNEKRNSIRNIFGPICESIEFDEETVKFILK